jgi:hypothetical protein
MSWTSHHSGRSSETGSRRRRIHHPKWRPRYRDGLVGPASRHGRFVKEDTRRNIREGISAAISVAPRAPSTYREMLRSPHIEDWTQSTLEEFRSWKELGVYSVTRVQRGQRRLGTKPVYVCKPNADGNVDRFKTRYVVLGNLQKEGQDYVETSSPTARPKCTRWT